MNNRLIIAAGLAAAAFAAGPAAAQDAQVVRSIAANCANCHGTNGKAVPNAGMVALAGQTKEALVRGLKEFRAGARPATVMHQIAKGYTDEQIELVAGFFAAQK